MDWVIPTDISRISTYRVLDAENKIEDPAQLSSPPEDIVKWYKNMVTGRRFFLYESGSD